MYVVCVCVFVCVRVCVSLCVCSGKWLVWCVFVCVSRGEPRLPVTSKHGSLRPRVAFSRLGHSSGSPSSQRRDTRCCLQVVAAVLILGHAFDGQFGGAGVGVGVVFGVGVGEKWN